MKLNSIEDLYVDLLRDMYSGEKQLVKTLPKLAKTAISADLKDLLEDHLTETEEQIMRLDQVFESLDKKPGSEVCEAMEGLIEEGEAMAKNAAEDVRDAGLIACVQKIEHYEIASYGTLCEFARVLGLQDQEQMLRETLGEEKEADQNLTRLAQSQSNQAAIAA